MTKQAAFLPNRWWSDKVKELKELLKQPAGSEHDWSPEVMKVHGWLQKLEKDFAEVVLNRGANQSVSDRLEMLRGYVSAVAKKLRQFDWYIQTASVDALTDQVTVSAWHAFTEGATKKVKTIGDLFKYEFTLDLAGLQGLIQQTLSVAKPEDHILKSIGMGQALIDRTRLEAKARKLLKIGKLEKDLVERIEFIQKVVESNWTEKPIQESERFDQFDLHGIRVIVDDNTVGPAEVKGYIKYLDHAYQLLKAKGFTSLWYGTVFIKCLDCGGVNQNTNGGVGANYQPEGTNHRGGDTIFIFSRPGPGMEELVAHELGHRYWYRMMSGEQRQRFQSLIRVRVNPNPRVLNRRKKIDSHRIVADVWQVLDRVEAQISRSPQNAETWVRKIDGPEQAAIMTMDDALLRVPKDIRDKHISSRQRIATFLATAEAAAKLVTRDVDKGVAPKLSGVYDALLDLRREVSAYVLTVVQEYDLFLEEELAPKMKEYDILSDGPVEAVSDYGQTNIEDAFAEAFAFFVVGRDMTRAQIESFKSVLSPGFRTAMIWDYRTPSQKSAS